MRVLCQPHLGGLLDGLELDDGSGLCSGLSRHNVKPVLQPGRVLRVRREQRVVGRVSTRYGHEGALHGGVFGRILGRGGRLPRGRVDFRKQRARVDDGLIHPKTGAVGGYEARARRVGDASERGTEKEQSRSARANFHCDELSIIYLGKRVGIQATSENALISFELILANSVMPPDFDSGPTESTLQRISSLQKISASGSPAAVPAPCF